MESVIILRGSIAYTQACNLHQVKPVSAEFYNIAEGGRIVVDPEGSTSFDLKPQPAEDPEVVENTPDFLGLL